MFKDVKVLELASVLAGPAVGQFFAELGASVIKVENAKSGGDVTRGWKTAGEDTDDRSAYFCAVNWGKKSIAVDLETGAGQAVVQELARQSDIVIASYKPGDAATLGVDYATLQKLNPSLIYGQITGYGPQNPRLGYDAVIQAEAGFMFMNGEPGGNSLKMPVALIDILAAHHLKEAILIAMLQQTRTGKGCFIDVSLIQAAISSLANQATNWLVSNKIPEKQGSAHPNIAPYGDVFITADRQEVLLAIGNDRQFHDLCRVLEQPLLAKERRFATNRDRVLNRIPLLAILQEKFSDWNVEPLMRAFMGEKIPAGRIQSMETVFQTEEAKALLLNAQDRIGVRTYVGSQDLHDASHFLPPPHVGEHTHEVLAQSLQMSLQAIRQLQADGIVR